MAMFRYMSLAACLAVIASLSGDLWACGDKFLVPSRGIRVQRGPVIHESARVLLYATPGSRLSATFHTLSVEGTLRKAGHRPTTISSDRVFDAALRDGAWDIVIVDLANGPRVPRGLTTAIVVALAPDTSRETIVAAKKEYAQVLRAPTKNRAFVEAVERVIVAGAKARKAATTTGI
jgi:hypothetical protein